MNRLPLAVSLAGLLAWAALACPSGGTPSGSKGSGAAALAEIPPSVPTDLQGCREDGPCLDLPPGGLFTWDGEGSQDVCLSGRRLGQTPGRVLLGGVVREPRSWSDTQVCFAVEPLALNDGLVRVEDARGVPSNDVGFLTPARQVRLHLPERVEVGDVVTVTGENLGYPPYFSVTPNLLGGGGAQIELVPLSAGRDQVFSYGKLGRELGRVTADVWPKLSVGCVAGPRTFCEVAGLGLGAARGTPAQIAAQGYQVTVGGLDAPILQVDPTKLRVQWPDELAPGAHTLEYTLPDGLQASIQVERTDEPLLVRVGSEDPDAYFFDMANPRPTVEGELVTVERWARDWGLDSHGKPFPRELRRQLVTYDMADSQPRGAFEPPANQQTPLDYAGLSEQEVVGEGARPVHLAGARYLAAPEGLYAFQPSGQGVQRPAAVSLVAQGAYRWLADVRLVGGDLVLAVGDAAGVTHLTRVSAGTDGLTAAAVGSVQGAPALGTTNRNLHNPGAYLSDQGVYVLPCRNNTRYDQEVTFYPLDQAADGWTVGEPARVWGGVGVTPGSPDVLLACRADAQGLWFVASARERAGAAVYQHTPSAGLQEIAFVPWDLVPGSEAPLPERGGSFVQDLARTDAGEVVLLLADRSQQPQRLRLARWDGADWVLGAPFGDTMGAERGEVCLGPTTLADCPERGAHACVPAACPIQPETFVRRQHTQLGEAALTLAAGTAFVTWSAQDLDADPRTYPWRLHEGFLGAVPVP